MNETNHTRFRKRAAALAVASCMSLAPMVGEAAGLGKLTVLSGLGQPLRAEVDISANKDELAGMTAKLAPQDSFKQAGVDFATVLFDLRFTVDKRPNGQSVLRVTSHKPINEPFLDFLVELNWPTGRLVREYTFLLDPPEMAAKDARPVVDARVVETVRGGGAADEKRGPQKQAPVARSAPAPKVAAEPVKKPETGSTRVVERGDTLRKIASETKHEGVSLEQMLVGLFKSNPDAFAGQNINRLKAGAILNIPDQAAVESVSPGEARKIYVSQAADWNAYRQKLAATTEKMPVKDEGAATQSSAGKITAKVEDKAAPAQQSKDQVKVARTDADAKSAAAAAAAQTADQVAKDKALKDAQERMVALEKNVNELQKLLDLKNQKLAELQQPAKKEEPKPVEVAKPVEPPKPVEVAPPPAPKVEEAPKPTESPKVDEAAKPAEAVKAPEVKPAEPPKPEKPKVVVPPPTPEPEPGLVDSMMEDPLPLIGGGGVLALLAGYLFLRRRRADSAAVETTAVPMPSSLGPNSVFRMTGGQSVDTGNTPPQTGEFSQTGPGTIDTDEVDPVAEADVYMAYGRDTQAEEILLDALQKDPQRTAIHAKLLEIYANRRSTKQFETLASELYAHTGGVGPEWEKVAALGLGLDPNNPLYSASRRDDMPAPVADIVEPASQLTIDMSSEALPVAESSVPLPELPEAETFERDTFVLPKEPQEESSAPGEPVAEAPAVDDGMTLDFDLGMVEEAPAPVAEVAAAPALEPAPPEESDALDFDLGSQFAAPVAVVEEAPQVAAVEEAPAGLDFDLDVPVEQAVDYVPSEVAVPAPDFSPEGTMVMPSVVENEELDVGLGTWVGGDNPPASMSGETAAADAAPMELPPADEAAAMTQTVVNQLSGVDTFVGENLLSFGEPSESESRLAQTMINTGVVDTDSLEFDVKLTDSMFLGQPMETPDFDMGAINLDLSAPPVAEAPSPAALEPVATPAVAETAAESPKHDGLWEEANTKLDLAKAYEEMGDLEGARELLQEVIGDAPADLAEQAKTILDRIGG